MPSSKVYILRGASTPISAHLSGQPPQGSYLTSERPVNTGVQAYPGILAQSFYSQGLAILGMT